MFGNNVAARGRRCDDFVALSGLRGQQGHAGVGGHAVGSEVCVGGPVTMRRMPEGTAPCVEDLRGVALGGRMVW